MMKTSFIQSISDRGLLLIYDVEEIIMMNIYTMPQIVEYSRLIIILNEKEPSGGMNPMKLGMNADGFWAQFINSSLNLFFK